MKQTVLTVLGVLGAAVAALFGGWSAALTTLLLFMSADYLSGLVVAAVFRRSPKSATGALDSRAGWHGLVRKGMTLLVVLVACRLDLLLGVHYLRDASVVAFCANEALSILENAGLMGVPIPPAVRDALDLLKERAPHD